MYETKLLDKSQVQAGVANTKLSAFPFWLASHKIRNPFGGIYFVLVLLCLRAVLDKAATKSVGSWLKLFVHISISLVQLK